MEIMASRWIRFKAVGHRNVKGTHRTTLEITRESYLTPRGDCIIGVSSEASLRDLPEWFKQAAKKPDTIIIMVLCSRGICDSIVGKGHHDLSFDDPTRIVVRKSNYVDAKTLMVKANKSAKDVRRDLIEELKDEAILNVYLTVLDTR